MAREEKFEVKDDKGKKYLKQIFTQTQTLENFNLYEYANLLQKKNNLQDQLNEIDRLINEAKKLNLDK